MNLLKNPLQYLKKQFSSNQVSVSLNKNSQSSYQLQDIRPINPSILNPIFGNKNKSFNKQEELVYQNKRIGFIGVGTISKAIIQGILNPQIDGKRAKSIIVSPRNIKNSFELSAQYEQVQVAQSNQEVINQSDWVIIGLLTTQIKDVLKDLKFKDGQTVINLAAMPENEFVQNLNNSDKVQIVRACPLPPVANNIGTTILYPQNKNVKEMFDQLGSTVQVQNQSEIYALQGMACLQGMQFQIMKSTYDWMVQKHNIDQDTAKKYVLDTYQSICQDAGNKICKQRKMFQDIIDEQTPGGLNEQNLKLLQKQGFFDQIQIVLDKTYNKMVKK